MAKQPTQRALTKKHMARLEKEQIQQRYLMIGAIVVIVLVVGIIIYGVLDQTLLKNMRPVAKVGSQNISTAQFQKEVKFNRFSLINQLRSMTADPMNLQFFGSYIQQLASQLNDPNTIGQQTLDSMEEDILVQQEAKKRGIAISDADLNKAFQGAFGFFPEGTETPTITASPYNTATLSATQTLLFPPTATFTITPTSSPTPSTTQGPTETATPAQSATPTLAETPTLAITQTPSVTETPTLSPTPYTTQAFQTNVSNYVTNVKSIGYSEADLKELIRKRLLRQKLSDAINSDVKDVAEQVWARHILVATEDEAKKVLDRLNKGENFADVARAVSTDTGSAQQGGDLGWFPRGQMYKAFEDAAFSMKIGEISQPVKTEAGYHIIQVLGHENRPLTEAQIQNAQQAGFQKWLDAAKAAANIQVYNWQAVVPSEPVVPSDLQAVLDQLNQNLNQSLPAIPKTQATPAGPQP